MKIAKDTYYIGVDDNEIDLFEGMYPVPNGMAYNSYVILDEKIAVFDSVDCNFKGEWLLNLSVLLNGKTPDYLIVQHMEPDHSANVLAFACAYKSAKIVASKSAFVMMKNHFGDDFTGRQIIVSDGDTLSLGVHTLRFFSAPMVHWPEVIVSFDEYTKTLFSADAFGKFGALSGTLVAGEKTNDETDDWACEARRYYFGIVGKYGVQVQNLLNKLAVVDVKTICPLHGPVLSDNLGYYLDLYNTWSSYGVESDGVAIFYTSVYGNTKSAVEMLVRALRESGCKKVVVTDLARSDMSEAVEDAFRYGKVVFATTTYNGEIFPFMRDFLHNLIERNFQNRTVGFIENGSWAPFATRTMRGILEKCKNLDYTENTVKILSVVNDESKAQILALAKELCEK